MRRPSLLTLVGAALALGAAVCAVMSVVFLSILPFQVRVVTTMAVVGAVGAVLLAATCLLQVVAWRRGTRGWVRPSWWAHVASYLALLLAVVGLAWVCASTVPGGPLFWMTLVGAVLALLGQSVGAVQYLRDDGAPGTIGAHIRRFVERTNARADRELDERGAA